MFRELVQSVQKATAMRCDVESKDGQTTWSARNTLEITA